MRRAVTDPPARTSWPCVDRERAGPGVRYELVTLNGAPALFLRDGDALLAAMWIECDGERIHALRHPGKLARLLAVTKPAASASLH